MAGIDQDLAGLPLAANNDPSTLAVQKPGVQAGNSDPAYTQPYQDLAGLTRDVRVAASILEAQLNFHHREQWHIIRAELLRLAREVGELRAANESVRVCRNHTADVAADGECLVCEAERAEAELAALERRIAEAPTGTFTAGGVLTVTTLTLGGQRVALLPVGGE